MLYYRMSLQQQNRMFSFIPKIFLKFSFHLLSLIMSQAAHLREMLRNPPLTGSPTARVQK